MKITLPTGVRKVCNRFTTNYKKSTNPLTLGLRQQYKHEQREIHIINAGSALCGMASLYGMASGNVPMTSLGAGFGAYGLFITLIAKLNSRIGNSAEYKAIQQRATKIFSKR